MQREEVCVLVITYVCISREICVNLIVIHSQGVYLFE